MTHPNASTALARVVVDELANQGVRLCVISPGSRSGALAIAASRHQEMETRVVIDERSAGFHALGVARASGMPTVVVTTSGSATANLYPAIVEADMSCVPLVVVTADRPAELQGIGANQTIDQVEMFGSKVRVSAGIEAPGSRDDLNEQWRSTVARLTSVARDIPPGPVHLNVRFSEPTVPVTDDGRARGEEYPFATPRIGEKQSRASQQSLDDLARLPPDKGLVIAGDGDYDRPGVLERAAELGWPVLATALSGLRGEPVVSSYHHVLSKGVPSGLRPDTVVAVGAIGPSPRLETLFGAARHRVRVDRWGRSIDPGRNATDRYRGDVVDLLARVDGAADPGWSAVWAEADRQCREHLADVVAREESMSGAAVVEALNRVRWVSLVVASSLPIREVDAHLVHPGAVYANRGASGIDGFVSTALGIASASDRTLAVAGDLSLLHDSNGFLHDGEIDLTVVVMDNGGGGLFDSLPQRAHAPDYERLFVTSPNRRMEDLARLHHLEFAEARDSATLEGVVSDAIERPGVGLVRVPIDREVDLRLRSQLDE